MVFWLTGNQNLSSSEYLLIFDYWLREKLYLNWTPEVADFLLNLQVNLSLMKSSSNMPHPPFSRADQGSVLKELAFAMINCI